MGTPRYFLFISFLFTFLVTAISFGQIKFKQLDGYQIKSSDSDLFDITETRRIIPLDGRWNVYSNEDKEKKRVSVEVPSVFEGEGELVFEKSFQINQDQLNNNNFSIYFLGLNYSADISVNNKIIYRHSGGEFPFDLELPKDVLKANRNNLLSVKLLYKLDSENTIPLKQRFLFPKNYGGIFRDVYLQATPNVSISDADIYSKYDSRSGRVRFSINSRIENFERTNADTSANGNQFNLKVLFLSPSGTTVASSEQEFQLVKNKEKTVAQTLEITSPDLWSPSNPESYTVLFELRRNGSIIDRLNRKASVYSLVPSKDSFTLNGSPFMIQAVEFVSSNFDRGSMFTYEQMEKDMRLIKETGFNAVKFSKVVPHPYYLVLCERLGLLPFVELPICSVPTKLASDANFIQRSQNYLNNFIKAYKKYSVIAGIGLGSSYLPQAESHINLISDLAGIVKKHMNTLTYASFSGYNLSAVQNLDLYGLELINSSPSEYNKEIDILKNQFGAGKIFISNASYIVNIGSTDGYVNKYSFEAQAKYYEDLIDYMNNNSLAGFCINSMFDYRGEYSSLLAGSISDNLYHIGIASENRSLDRIAYKVVSSKLHNSEKVTIPIGTKKDDSPMIFIIFGILLAILLGVLVNSGRKFREDSSRALLRPYNFYADIRDQRLISSLQSYMLAILVSAVSGLLLSNLLFYFKENLFFEKLLLSFGSHSIIKNVSYLAWHPMMSIIILTILSLVILIFLTIAIKASAFFVRNRVFLSSVFYTVAWSFLPLVLFIPVGIVLYRMLVADVANTYLFGALIIFTIWIFYRLMKGIYVIFDVNPGSVYFYSFLFIFIIAGGITLYYEFHNSFIEYLQLSIRQNNIIR